MRETCNEKYYIGIDYLRILSCVGIVMMHMLSYENNHYTFTKKLALIIPYFTDFVFVFMVISAFVLCLKYYDDVINGNFNVLCFYKKRTRKIIPLFMLLVCVDIFVNHSKQALIEGIADISLLFGLFPNSIGVVGVGWFIGLIFAFYYIFPFFCFLIRDKRVALISFVMSIFMNYVVGTYFNVERHNIVFSLCFFVLGGIIFLYRSNLEKAPKLFTLVLLSLALAAYFYNQNTITRLALAGSLLVVAIGISKEALLSKATLLGSVSYEVYLLHMPVFRLISHFNINYMFGYGMFQYFFTVIIVLSLSVLIAILFNKVFAYGMRWIEKK